MKLPLSPSPPNRARIFPDGIMKAFDGTAQPVQKWLALLELEVHFRQDCQDQFRRKSPRSSRSPEAGPSSADLAPSTSLLQLPQELVIYIFNLLIRSETDEECAPIDLFMPHFWALAATLSLNDRLYEGAFSASLQVDSFALHISALHARPYSDGRLPWSVEGILQLAWLKGYHHHLRRVTELRLFWDPVEDAENAPFEKVLRPFAGLACLDLQCAATAKLPPTGRNTWSLPPSLRTLRLWSFTIDLPALSQVLSEAHELCSLSLSQCAVVVDGPRHFGRIQWPIHPQIKTLKVQETSVPWSAPNDLDRLASNDLVEMFPNVQHLSLDTQPWHPRSSRSFPFCLRESLLVNTQTLAINVSTFKGDDEALDRLILDIVLSITAFPHLKRLRFAYVDHNSSDHEEKLHLNKLSVTWFWLLFFVLKQRVETLAVDVLEGRQVSKTLLQGLLESLEYASSIDPSRRLKQLSLNISPRAPEERPVENQEYLDRVLKGVRFHAELAGISLSLHGPHNA